MLCCGECNVETETIFTEIVLIESHPNLQNRKLKKWTEKIANKKRISETTNANSAYKYKQLLNINKENQTANDILDLQQTKRRGNAQIITESRYIGDENGAETGRFHQSRATLNKSRNENSTKRIIQSKTTQFGSQGRRSSSMFYKQREIEVMKGQLEKLKQVEHALRKDKMEKRYLYQKQLLKINHLKEDLKLKSKERSDDLHELKQLFSKHKQKSTNL